MRTFVKAVIYIVLIGYLVWKYAIPFFNSYQIEDETVKLYSSLSSDPVPWQVFRTSTDGNSIYMADFGDSAETTLIFGAFHGDEQGGFNLVVELARFLRKNPSAINKRAVLVPVLNPDGLLAGTRTNSNKVDVNRNFPTKNWSPAYKNDRNHPGSEPASEAETITAIELIQKYRPTKIISIHAALHVVNYDGPGLGLAKEIARYNKYDVSGDIGYATPGSFGTYAGKELNIPTITLELPSYNPQQAWLDNKDALIRAINF